MEWLSQKTTFTSKDRGNFNLHDDYQPFKGQVHTIVVSKAQDGTLSFEPSSLESEAEYRQWIEKSRLSCLETRCPTLVLVMHQKLKGDEMDPTHLPYGEATFKYACKNLFQHRSITHTLKRNSPTVFNSRPIHWGPGSPGHSTVYNCISDTESLDGDGNIILSATCFTDTPLTYGVFYGCTTRASTQITDWLKSCGESCFHPLILPMIFVELERKRLLNAGEAQGSNLRQRVLDMDIKSRSPEEKISKRKTSRPTVSTGDSETISMLLSMNELKNGLEALLMQLPSMRDHLDKPSDIKLPSLPIERSVIDICGVNMDLRLKEMMMELQSKLRKYEGLLGTITLATQMEATDFTRTDSWVNFTIARASKRDSTHMKKISNMGMLFLPGTFLATLFSMSFFNWIPSADNELISPWVALYFGLTAITTAFAILYWKKRGSNEESDSKNQFMNDLEGARAWMNEASLRRSYSAQSHNTESAKSVSDEERPVTPDREGITMDTLNVTR